MSVKLGNIAIQEIPLGDVPIGRGYLGDILVYQKRQPPYLEIEPTLLWVYPDFERTNDVYSNTTWNIH